jgi:hypothetical protein
VRTVDLRGRMQPSDSRTHTDRINDWVGSNVYVQGVARDREDIPMPQGDTRRYVLSAMSWDGFRRLPVGSIVDVAASQVGPHHEKHPDEKYSKEHMEAYDRMHGPRLPMVVEETISLAEHRRIVAALESREPMGIAALSPEAIAAVKEAAEAAKIELPSLKDDDD